MVKIVEDITGNIRKRIENLKRTGKKEVEITKKLIEDLKDLEIVEGPFDFSNSTTMNVLEAAQKGAKLNKELFDALERDIAGGEFELGEKIFG